MPYDINEHRHRFSVWAAARAVQRGFSVRVDTLRNALEACGVVRFLHKENLDAINEIRFNARHRAWCTSVVNYLEKASVKRVTFGRAAKLIAIYLKSVVVLGPDSGTAFARIAHPPIDGILLGKIAVCKDVNSKRKTKWARIKWTKLNEEQYYELINQLREALGPEEPFWKLERYWTVTIDSTLDAADRRIDQGSEIVHDEFWQKVESADRAREVDGSGKKRRTKR